MPYEILKKFEPLPPNARIYKADAVSMYTNIETNHGLEILRKFLEKLKRDGRRPPDFDVEMVLKRLGGDKEFTAGGTRLPSWVSPKNRLSNFLR